MRSGQISIEDRSIPILLHITGLPRNDQKTETTIPGILPVGYSLCEFSFRTLKGTAKPTETAPCGRDDKLSKHVQYSWWSYIILLYSVTFRKPAIEFLWPACINWSQQTSFSTGLEHKQKLWVCLSLSLVKCTKLFTSAKSITVHRTFFHCLQNFPANLSFSDHRMAIGRENPHLCSLQYGSRHVFWVF